MQSFRAEAFQPPQLLSEFRFSVEWLLICNNVQSHIRYNELMDRRFLRSVTALPVLFAGPAIAADMPLKAPPAPPASVFSWTGFYAGLNAGGSWGRARSEFNISDFTSTAASDAVNPDGVIGGGQLGYNWQLDPNWLIGAEADIQASTEKASTTRFDTVDGEGVTTNYEAKIDWFGTVRGRLGYVFDRRILLYATGGLAYGRVAISGTSNDSLLGGATLSTTAFSNADINTGWTAGAGVEGVAWDSRWTWKVEYLYLDLGSIDAAVASGLTMTHATTKFTDNVVRAGLNLHF
jgi:outer membrane immunogenic protein